MNNYFNEIKTGLEQAIEMETRSKLGEKFDKLKSDAREIDEVRDFLQELEDAYNSITQEDVDAIEELERANLMEPRKEK